MGSKTLPLYTVDQYAETLMGQRISMVKGVAQVQVYGSQKYAVRIQLDPQALATRQIGIDDVHAAVQNANVNLPVGTLYGEHRAFTLQANGQLTHASLLSPVDRRLPKRLAGAPRRSGQGLRQRAKRSRRELVERYRLCRSGHRAPAGHEHRRSGGCGEGAAAAVSRHHSTVGGDADSLRRIRFHPKFGGGREIHAVPGHRSRVSS